MMVTPVRLPLGRARLGDEAQLDRVAAYTKDDRNGRGGTFGCYRRGVSDRNNHLNVAAHEVGGQSGQPIIVAQRPAVFDRQIFTLDVASFGQSLVECRYNRPV
jgi:hypothetical protein